jgi:hypothetical protein
MDPAKRNPWLLGRLFLRYAIKSVECHGDEAIGPDQIDKLHHAGLSERCNRLPIAQLGQYLPGNQRGCDVVGNALLVREIARPGYDR